MQYKIWIVGSALERDFTAHIVWWHCAIAQLRTLEGTLPGTLRFEVASSFLFHLHASQKPPPKDMEEKQHHSTPETWQGR